MFNVHLSFRKGQVHIIQEKLQPKTTKKILFSVPGDEAINLEFPIPSYLPQKKKCVVHLQSDEKRHLDLGGLVGFLVALKKWDGIPNTGRFQPSTVTNKWWNSTYGMVQEPLWYVLGNGWSLQSSIVGGTSLQFHMIFNTGSTGPLGQLPFWSIPKYQIKFGVEHITLLPCGCISESRMAPQIRPWDSETYGTTTTRDKTEIQHSKKMLGNHYT